MIQLLIVDDHQLFAEGLKSMFSPDDEMQVVAHTVNGFDAPSILESYQIDVILMDIDMPNVNGLETMDIIKNAGFDTPVLILTTYQSMKFIKRALNKGAYGYILKAASKKDLLEAIDTVSKRKSYFHEQISEEVFDYFRGENRSDVYNVTLSSREIEVVNCLAMGLNSKKIGEALFISEQTVRTHRRNIMHKLHVNTSAELIHMAIEKGWIAI